MVTVGTSVAALAAEAATAAVPDDAPLTDGMAIDGTDGMDGADTDALDTDGVFSVGLLIVGTFGNNGTAL